MHENESTNGVVSAFADGSRASQSGLVAIEPDRVRQLELDCARLNAELEAVTFERDEYRKCVYGYAWDEMHMSKEEAEAYFTELLRRPEDLVSLDPVIDELERSQAASETSQ